MERVPTDDLAWKYAIISMHGALQGYTCVVLRNGNSFLTWSERDFKKWIDAYENGKVLPDPRLDFFMDLYDKAFGDEGGGLFRENISWLNDTRNSLVHFNTDSFGIHRETAVLACNEALKAIKLAPEKAAGIFFYSEEQSRKFKVTCSRAEDVLASAAKKA